MKVALLSPLPAVTGQAPESGVAAYTASLVRSMSGQHDLTILAQKLAAPGNLGLSEVTRVWTPTMLVAAQVRRALADDPPDLLHVQHEFNLYGGLLQGAALTLMLMARHRMGARTVTTIHGVVPPGVVTPRFIARHSLPRSVHVIRAGFRIAYRALAASSDLVIVHHDHFRHVLMRAYGIRSSKVVVIPHGAPDANGPPRHNGNPLPKRVLMLGFLAGYKLPEILVDVAQMDAVPNAMFDFCVGANPRISDRNYVKRYRELERRVKALGARATWRGYIPDSSLAPTLDQTDVLVLPYTECVSVGGVAALAQRSRTPICYSRPLRPLFGAGPLEFELNGPALAGAIRRSFSAQASSSGSVFASWSDAARATEAVWSRLLGSR